MTMRLSSALLLVGLVALCAMQAGQAMPQVLSGGGGTMLVVREVEEQSSTDVEQVAVGDRQYLVRSGENDVDTSDEEDEETDLGGGVVVEMDLDDELDGAAVSTQPPPRPRCRLRCCWKSCTRRGYNWGICLCKKCRCYY